MKAFFLIHFGRRILTFYNSLFKLKSLAYLSGVKIQHYLVDIDGMRN